MKYMILLLMLLTLVGCRENTSSPTASVDRTSCYTYINQRDTVALELLTQNNQLTGVLTYNLFEKDKNTGTLTGVKRGDTLVATYKFLSEGIISSRQVVFLKKGTHLIEGYGAIRQGDDFMEYSDISSLDFTGSIILTPVNCNTPSQ